MIVLDSTATLGGREVREGFGGFIASTICQPHKTGTAAQPSAADDNQKGVRP